MVVTNFAALANTGRISSSAVDAAFAQALAIGGDASASLVKPVYPGGASAPMPRSLSDIHGQVIRLKDFGAKGDKLTDDTVAINACIAEINSIPASAQPFPVSVLVEPGSFTHTSALTPITAPCRFIAPDPRGGCLRPVGNFDALTFQGSSAAALSYGGLRGLEIDCSGLTGGHAVVADTTQDFAVLDSLIFGSAASAFDAISIRQCGNAIFEKLEVLGFENYGLKGYGTFASRNGGTDTNNVVTIRDCDFCGTFDGSRATTQADAIWFDGAMQTLRLETTACINAGRGLRLTNTPGVANPHFMQFLYGFDFEVENMYYECIRAEAVIAMVFHTLFAAGSVTTSNIYLGPQAYGTKFFGGESSAAYLHGLDIEGADDDTELYGFDVYNNSQAGAGAANGVNFASSGNLRVQGGNIGKLLGKFGDAGYTVENQKYGLANVGSGNASVGNAGLLGNQTAPISGLTNVTSCIGVPWTSVAITPSAQTGTLTTASGTFRYEKSGATLRFSAQINITTNGSGAGEVMFTLPNGWIAAAAAAGSGEDVGSSGNSLQWFLPAGSGTIAIYNYNHTYPASSGSVLLISGTVEVTA